MKVLHVIPAIAARYGGPSTAVLQMCRALSAAGADVHLAATNADGLGRMPQSPDVWSTIDGVRTILFKRQWSEALKYSSPLAAWLRTSVAEYDAVHVHALLSHACLAAARACRASGIPYVVRPLGTLDPWSLAQKPWRKRLLLAMGGRTALSGAAAVHYTAAGEQRLVEAAFHTRRGFVLPLGIDASFLDEDTVAQEEREQRPYVLALSRLHPVKALDVLIDAFGDIHTDGSAWRLVIAGDGDDEYARGLRAQAATSPAASAIEFRGWVDGAEKHALLREASLYALPSHHENFGVSLVEALACGVPAVVSSHVLVGDDLAAANAAWVTANDRTSLASTLRAAMTDSRLRSQKSVAARRFASELAWPRVAARLLEVYASLEADPSVSRRHARLTSPPVAKGL